MTLCVHCEKEITSEHVYIRYAESKRFAHIKCVSFPSAAETDRLLAIMGSSLNRPSAKQFRRHLRKVA